MRRTRPLLTALLASSLGACAQTHLTPINPDAGPPAAEDAGAPCELATAEGTWEPTGGLPGGAIDALAYDGTTYLAVSRRRLFSASDFDGPWTALPEVGDLGLRPTLAASADGLFARAGDAVVRSTDGGRSWVPAGDGLDGASVTRLEVSGGETLAITESALFVFRDGAWSHAIDLPPGGVVEAHRLGDGWIARSSGLQIVASSPDGWVGAGLADLGLDLLAGDRLFVLGSGGQVWRSDDEGASWERVGTAGDSLARSLGATEDGALLVLGFAGRVWRSTDGGVRFDRIDGVEARAVAHLTDPEVRFVADGPSGFLYADGGLVVRSAGGATVTAGPSPMTTGARAMACTARECLAVSAEPRLFSHAQGGEAWVDRGPVPPAIQGVTSVTAIGDAIWLGTEGAGVMVMRDGELEPVGTGFPELSGGSHVGSRTVPITGMARLHGALFAATSGGGAYRLLDGSDAWLPINGGIDVVSRDDFGRPSRVSLIDLLTHQGRLVTAGQSPLYLDALTGRWEAASAPATDIFLALTASDAGVFALTRLEGGGARLARSDDGRLYEPLSIPSSEPRGLIAFGGELWLAGADGVWRSRDRGASFEPVDAGLDGTPGPFAVSPDALWLSTDRGVYRRPIACEVQR